MTADYIPTEKATGLTSGPKVQLNAYQKKLLFLLGVATFFEGYDHMALAQILPTIRAEMHLTEWETGALLSFVNLGTVIAYVLVRQADRFGRKPMLTWTIAGYTLFSFLSALVSSALPFALLQFVARIFLIGEWVVSTIYAAEEFPASRRGHVIGLIGAWASVGSVVCAGVVPLLVRSPWGWRTVYLVGTIPLILVSIVRTSLKETARFESLTPEEKIPPSLMRIVKTPYWPRVMQLALIWGTTYLCTQTVITFFKQHAVEDLHMADTRVGLLISAGAVLAMPMVFFVGHFLDRIGRRKTAVIVFVMTSLGALGCYTLKGELLLFLPVVFAMFGVSAVLPVLNAYSTELFPTDLRSEAFAWANNLLGRLGYVVAPLAVGYLAQSVGWGMAVASTSIFPIIALILILRWLPETGGKELEETSKLA